MVSNRSEDTVIFSGLTPEITDMDIFYDALEAFFKKKQDIDPSDRFNYILFQADKLNYLDDFTFDYNEVITTLKDLESTVVHTDIASGIYGALPLIIGVFKKIGDKCFRIIIFIDSGSSTIPDYQMPILDDLIEKSDVLSTFIDIIGINIENAEEKSKIKKLAQNTGGDFYNLKNVSEIGETLNLLSVKKEMNGRRNPKQIQSLKSARENILRKYSKIKYKLNQESNGKIKDSKH